VDIIESHRVALRGQNLKLADNAVARAQFKDATNGRGSVEDWLADVVQQSGYAFEGEQSAT
jgi:hypothetical protein